MKIKSALLLSIALGAVATTAHADVLTFKFTGTVVQGFPMAPAGAQVTGTFSYDTAVAPYQQSGEPAGPGNGDATYLASSNITLAVNGHSVTAAVTTVYVVNNFGGNVEDSLTLSGEQMTLDGTLFPQGNVGFTLASGPGRTHVLRNTDLPKHIQVNRYDGANFGWVMVDGSSNGTVLSFVIDRIKLEGRED